MEHVLRGHSRLPHQQPCAGPPSCSYPLPQRSHRAPTARTSHTSPQASSAASPAAVQRSGPQPQSLPDSSAALHRLSRSLHIARAASPLAAETLAAEDEDGQPDEQPAPFERMHEGDGAYAELAEAISPDALYEVLDLRAELAAFLREAERPLTDGLAGLHEIASAAKWSLPEADQQLIQAARLKHERELLEQAEADAESGTDVQPAERLDAAQDPREFENAEDDLELKALVAKLRGADEKSAARALNPGSIPEEEDELSPAMQRRRKRAKAARASLTAGTKQAAWAPVSEHSDEVLSQMLWMKQLKRAYLRPQPGDMNNQAGTELASMHINLTHKLLSRDEEQVLSKYFVAFRQYEIVSDALHTQNRQQPSDEDWADACGFAEHREAFMVKLRRARQAKELFENCNLRMVAKIANRYMAQGVDMEDLLAAGVTGLQKAISRFDPDRGFKFSTYSHWWIRQTIQRCVIQQGRIIRIPGHLYDLRYKIRTAAHELAKQTGAAPTDAAIAAHMNVPLSKVLSIQHSFRGPKSLELADASEGPTGNKQQPVSGYLAGGEDDEEELPQDQSPVELPERADFERPETQTNNVVRAVIEASLKLLEPKEQVVMRMRYGLDDGEPRTLEEIGRYFKVLVQVTRERVRQVEIRAFRKLKNAPKHGTLIEDAVNASFHSKFV